MTRLSADRALCAYLQMVAGLPRLSDAQRQALAAEAGAGDALALRALAQSHLPWVLAAAAQRRGAGVRFDRLLAVGNQALLRALRQAPQGGEGLADAVAQALDGALARAASQPGRPRL
jgi:DNA-directed RNA polymerase sigma subunit (sigma70/sigma32)